MERILDINQQPPYVEVYSDAPLMCASLVNTRQALAGSSPAEQVYWCHGIQCQMDDIANSLGLYKIKVLSNDNQACLFAISPDMPSRQQAEVMLHAALQLRDALSQMDMPTGRRIAAKVTIHAGKYAGAVVGRSAWTYDLFGEDVQLLLDMDRVNSPNSIQVSDAALALISTRSGQFTPVLKVNCNGREIQMHAWTPEGFGSPAQQQQQRMQGQLVQQPAVSPAVGTRLQAVPPQQLCLQDVQMPSSQQQQHPQHWQPHWQQMQQEQQQQQQHALKQQPRELTAAIAAAQCAAKSTQWQGKVLLAGAAGSTAAAHCEVTSHNTMQPNLRFSDPVLEAAYMETQGQPLANLDLMFILLNLAVMACCMWDSTWQAGSAGGSWSQQLLAAWGQWLLLAVAAVWLLAAPSSYGRWREPLWVAHRMLSALHVASVLLLHMLPQRLVLSGVSAAASAAVTAGGAILPALHKGKLLTLLAQNLGLKVRFHVHIMTNTLTCTLLVLSSLWHWTSSSADSSLRQPPLWDLLQHLLLGWAAPTVLVYLWELDDRLRFMDTLEQQRNKAADAPQLKKCKDV